MRLRIVIGVLIGALVAWTVVATVLWATGDSGPVRVKTVTIERP